MILPPIPTPFDQEGRLDAGAFRELAEALEPLVDGLLIYGSNGEGVHLSPEERRLGLFALSPKKPFLVGLMEETLPQAERALEEAQESGAKGLLVTPPRYYYASLSDGLLRYYHTLAKRMPVWLYNKGGWCGRGYNAPHFSAGIHGPLPPTPQGLYHAQGNGPEDDPVELEPGRSLFDLGGLQSELEHLLGRPGAG